MKNSLNYAARNQALAAYDFGGEITDAIRFGSGHINETFNVSVLRDNNETKRFILQKINTNVFKNPGQVMDNIISVTEYLKEKIKQRGGDPSRETLSVLRTKKGESFFKDSAGGCWRCYEYVEDTFSLDKVEVPDHFYQAAKSFGAFLCMLKDYDASSLYETIPRFHDTPHRYRSLRRAVVADKFDRVESAIDEIAFAARHKKDCSRLFDLQKAGELPCRVTHNDTKLNNILFDPQTGAGICIVDLDTIMPGLALFDYGDAIRFGASTALEDEPDLDKVHFDLNLYELYTKGYLEGTDGALTPLECECLPWGAKIMTLECGIRFLTDYLQGDTYFRTQYDDHNLVRARTQFKLVAEMEEHWEEMYDILHKYIG